MKKYITFTEDENLRATKVSKPFSMNLKIETTMISLPEIEEN